MPSHVAIRDHARGRSVGCGAQAALAALRLHALRWPGLRVELLQAAGLRHGLLVRDRHHESMYRYHWRDLWRHGYNIHVI